MPTTDQSAMTAAATAAPAKSAAGAGRPDKRARGQIIVIFAGAIIVFMGLAAIVIDVSWFLSSQVRMQRAADAAALAGVVLLPGNVPGAVTLARTEASRNGFTSGVKGITVTPIQDPQSTRRMQVTISGPVNTYFARVLGFASFNAVVTSKAEYILPVPMGSPENYYGVFGLTRGLTETTTVMVPTPTAGTASSGDEHATTAPDATVLPAGSWTASAGVLGTAEQQRITAVGTDDLVNPNNNAPYIRTSTNSSTVIFGGFDLSPTLGAGESVTSIRGLQVYLDDAWLSANCGTSRIQVQVSEDAGANWSTAVNANQTGGLQTGSNNAQDYNWGSASNFTVWGNTWGPGNSRSWNSVNDFSATNFKVRLTAVKGCATAGLEIRLDHLRVVASYNTTYMVNVPTPTTTTLTDVNLRGPGSTCPTGLSDCYNADGAVLNPRGFWGTLNTQGAENVNGDAHQPYYDTRTSQISPNCNTISTVRACYDPTEYYNYAVEIPQGATGSVWVYDPGFCDVNTDRGTGDRWFSGSSGVTTTYEVWDTNNTLYDRSDDGIGSPPDGTVPNATSGGKFRNMAASDTSMAGSGGSECKYNTDSTYGDGRDYHNHWYLLASGLTGGSGGPNIYRVHTTSTDPANPTQQRGTDAENSFAIYASASSGTPRVYGLGAMQAFTPLKSNGGTTSSEFYLAQIDKVHAGKTVEISLWDPGDTTPLTASIEIEIPDGASSWTATPVTYTASTGTNNGGRADGGGGRPNCNTNKRLTESTAGIVTFTSGGASTTGNFNGCWLVIDAVIPDNYQALAQGWWKIKYTMTGNGVSNDVTTWKVQILGNPVHLIVN